MPKSLDFTLDASWLRGIAKVLDALNQTNTNEAEFYIRVTELTIAHGDGWSPGKAVYDENFEEWAFQPGYEALT